MNRLDKLSESFKDLSLTAQTRKYKIDWFRKNGWGFNDTAFMIGDDGVISLTGNRYTDAGKKLPNFRQWAEEVCGLNINNTTLPKLEKAIADEPIINEQFMEAIKNKVGEITTDTEQRVFHSHGQTMEDIYIVRNGKFERTVDVVVYIENEQQAEILVKAAVEHDVCLIVYGGGTNVTNALKPVTEEKRSIISVDVTRMNHIKWVDKKNNTACVEAGIVGKDLENELAKHGVMCGHEPDSVEFSTLGGWISTRASGMKKNRYGNIDDIILTVRIVTPLGTFERKQESPRISSGPNLNEFILGSEGTLGIITQATLKLRTIPECVEYDSIIFHDFVSGCDFMYEVAQSKIWPASLRLVDNQQFKFGMALKTPKDSKMQEFIDKAKKYFLLEIKKFDQDKMCMASIVYEGTKEEVAQQKASIKKILDKHNGFRAGAENGQRGYFLTFVIAYLRDFSFDFGYIAESFETSCPWKNVYPLIENTTKRIQEECKKQGIVVPPFISSRVTQVYDTGAAVYIYFGFLYYGLDGIDPVKVYDQIEGAAREEIMKNGGCISHHHGVGKLRKRFMKDSVGEVGIEMLKAVKQKVDPKNTFGSGNLI
ncbi:FAD-linked oxidase-like, C-terminal [Pseudocohnilembus persalinus]|uniref:Alkylglycerone-phosphate synthase n=1 Tax=Pseudocohnilembus persalinus TaxID=266149 RepID=A0A0V0QFM7_PSEPJ|nr:FAD-linked oxidase-like, C-terminal [Pseudocohnilembus persalinus]|eukprot:KRX00983.1 FAD-linked oxidase-like, C-terminal [Pseudocohnilembus persalinus]